MHMYRCTCVHTFVDPEDVVEDGRVRLGVEPGRDRLELGRVRTSFMAATRRQLNHDISASYHYDYSKVRL